MTIQAVVGSFVNICDLLDAPLLGQLPERFEFELELAKYTRNTGKYFPRGHVRAGSLLKFLLRRIINPRVKQATQAASSNMAKRTRMKRNK